jgi:putative cardiolipin synthase
VRKGVLFGILAVCASVVLLRRCNALPSLENRAPSTAMLDTGSTRLGRAISPLVQAHPGTSGIYPLAHARDAFTARVRLAQAAERTLDLQYYIWNRDMTGTLLFRAVQAAADRGVRVRLLLDDNNTSGLDRTLAAIDSHPKIEVRLFNPFVIRKPRIGYLIDFARANRRMHNKSFTADNQATIIGGRNVGDEYFEATEGPLFLDLDVLAVGQVVTEVSRDFDRYWASDSSYPADRLLPPVEPDEIEELAAAALEVERHPEAVDYMTALRSSGFDRELAEKRLPLEWTATQMVSDDPAKGLGRAAAEILFPEQLKATLGQPSRRLDLVAAYLVPTAAGVDWFVSMARRGVEVRVLTNALEATDSPLVHAGYAKRRKPLLEAGIKLFELRRLSPRPSRDRSPGRSGSSDSSLHAKTFAVDGSRVFIGSFNFDPRSRELNTELGFVIDSPALARRIESAFESAIPAMSYEVHLSEAGRLYWTELRGRSSVRHDTEPGTSSWGRAGVRLLSLLPIEWLL